VVGEGIAKPKNEKKVKDVTGNSLGKNTREANEKGQNKRKGKER